MSDCKQHGDLIVGHIYTVDFNGSTCGSCSAPHLGKFEATFLGHTLHGGQLCGLFRHKNAFRCGCGEMINGGWDPCGDGWISDLFTQQRESVEVDAPAEPEADRTTQETT